MHTIRLHGPWECEFTPESHGGVRYTRWFNRPTGLEEGQRVFVAIERVTAAGAVSLNSTPLGPIAQGDGPFTFEVTDAMALRNALVIEIELSPAQPPGASVKAGRTEVPNAFVGSVRLEIEEPA